MKQALGDEDSWLSVVRKLLHHLMSPCAGHNPPSVVTHSAPHIYHLQYRGPSVLGGTARAAPIDCGYRQNPRFPPNFLELITHFTGKRQRPPKAVQTRRHLQLKAKSCSCLWEWPVPVVSLCVPPESVCPLRQAVPMPVMPMHSKGCWALHRTLKTEALPSWEDNAAGTGRTLLVQEQ